MKKIEQFMADDGAIFSDRESCEQHERKLPTNDKLVEMSCYSLQGNCLVIRNIEDVKMFLEEGQDWLEKMAEDIWTGF